MSSADGSSWPAVEEHRSMLAESDLYLAAEEEMFALRTTSDTGVVLGIFISGVALPGFGRS